MFNKSKAKQMQEYLEQNQRKQPKASKAYKMSNAFGKGYEAIEMQKAIKKK